MKTDKTKLLQDIKSMKEKLASMEEELNKVEVFKHFPSKGDKYFFCTPWGRAEENVASYNDIRPNTYRTAKEAEKAYNKAVALEKIKRRLLELQGDWKPDWKDCDEKKVYIYYYHNTYAFEPEALYVSQSFQDLPYMKSEEIALTIIKEMEGELKLIFGIQ